MTAWFWSIVELIAEYVLYKTCLSYPANCQIFSCWDGVECKNIFDPLCPSNGVQWIATWGTVNQSRYYTLFFHKQHLYCVNEAKHVQIRHINNRHINQTNSWKYWNNMKCFAIPVCKTQRSAGKLSYTHLTRLAHLGKWMWMIHHGLWLHKSVQVYWCTIFLESSFLLRTIFLKPDKARNSMTQI